MAVRYEPNFSASHSAFAADVHRFFGQRPEGGRVSQTVVSAAIIDPERKLLLLTQRDHGTSHGGLWVTPGGKVEPGETHRAALERELREELGVSVDDLFGLAMTPLYTHEMTSTKTGLPVLVTCYVIELSSIRSKPSCLDATIGVGWFGAEMIAALPLGPADDAYRSRLVGAVWRDWLVSPPTPLVHT